MSLEAQVSEKSVLQNEMFVSILIEPLSKTFPILRRTEPLIVINVEVFLYSNSYSCRLGMKLEFSGQSSSSSSSSSLSCSLRVRCVPCFLVLKVELVPTSLLWSFNVPSSFWSVFQCLPWQSISVHPLYVL